MRAERINLDRYPSAEHAALEAEREAAKKALRDLGVDVDALLAEGT